MNKNKHLLLWSSLGVLILLFAAAGKENFGKEWRAIQKSARTPEGPLEVRLRQVINPGLRVSDRCVSCHVGMAPGEQGLTGHALATPHKPVFHSPAEYGCTTCHGGQGLATDKDDAHGNVHFWPQPMLPLKDSQAGCGTCHTALSVPAGAGLDKARQAFERLDCYACHRVDGRGGTIRPGGGGGMEGPDLSAAGIRGYETAWYDKHIAKSGAAGEGPWKNVFAAVSEPDRAALAAYLTTRVGAPRLIEAKAAFLGNGCLGCHKVSGVGGDAGPDLTRAGEKDPGQVNFTNVPGARTLGNWIAEHFRSPVGTVAGSQMPILGLPEKQIDLLTTYVLSLRRRDLPGAYMPRDRVQAERFGAREFAADGATIFSAICAGCHGQDGRGARYPGWPPYPAIASPDFLSLVSDAFLTATIRDGRPGRKMPAWGTQAGLKPEEIQRVIAYLRQLGGNLAVTPETTPPRRAEGNPQTGQWLYTANCSGCHGPNGEGGEGPALNNKVLLTHATDTYLLETIRRGRAGTAMQGFENPAPTRRALSRTEIEDIVVFIRTWETRK
ncbi:MAG: c-type cytochrome [Blastocatellia bacterium]